MSDWFIGGIYFDYCIMRLGVHWFEWIDEPATGRFDDENDNIDFVDVTDCPYTELVEAAKDAHARLLDIHSGKVSPVERRAKAQ